MKPILIIGHLDVVEARREDWTTDPFQFVEKDGYFYGRGTQDMKVNDAILVTTFIRFKREGYQPDRDLILALTADEEGGTSNGVDWLLKNHRDLVDAAFALNADAGGVTTVKGKPLNVDVEANEKLYADFELDATQPGRPQLAAGPGQRDLPYRGRSVAPGARTVSVRAEPDHAHLFRTARRARIGADGRRYARRFCGTPPDPQAIARLSMDARFNSLLRTTCVATRLNAGHANNALPQHAQAIVNCRILPGHAMEEIRAELDRDLRRSENYGEVR